MTVTVQIPYVTLIGNGTVTTFPFTYGLTEEYDLYVQVDGVQQLEYTDYTIENVNELGGEVEFTEAPAADAVVLIYRFTTRSQEIDYETAEPFPLETHEQGFDKFMRILQELIMSTFNGLGDDGLPYQLTFDLSVTQQAVTVTIVNSGGTDAVIPMWTDAEFAGVYAGEVVPLDINMPADESVTTYPEGYIWLGLE